MGKAVIIRGKIFPEHTQKCINSIRIWHSGELILSTWKNQEQNIYGVDRIILSDDPGPGPIQQSNRQLVSYQEGLKNCDSDLIMVTRSDIIHEKNLFDYFGTLNKYNERYKIFDHRVVVSNMMTINPDKNHPHIPLEIDKYFRVCDWFQVGKKNDLIKWSSVKQIFEMFKNSKLCTEQLWLTGLIKNEYINNFDINNILLYKFLFWDILINNFHIINMKSNGKAVNLNWINQPENLGCYLMEEEYLQKYNNL
jgi:hypothetical protein